MAVKSYSPPKFLVELLNARSPSGYEAEAQRVIDRYLKPVADKYSKDAMGNRIATINPKGDPVLMLAGHMDELGFIIKYIDTNGYLYFDTIGGHDRIIISGRRVSILGAKGVVKGVTGKRAVHLMSVEDRNKVPRLEEMWIDIGVKRKKDALKLVEIGDVATYDHNFEIINESIGTARAFDNKSGAYVVSETFRRLAKYKALKAKVVTVATAQEEIGTRGAITATYTVNPHIAIAVDVGHATDHPDCDNRKFGETKLGAGPIICRGANINPIVYKILVDCAKKGKIPYQLEADPRPTGTDARSIQIGREGVATGLVSIPLRYMHTPSEMVDLQDIENTVKLLVAFAKALKKGQYGHW